MQMYVSLNHTSVKAAMVSPSVLCVLPWFFYSAGAPVPERGWFLQKTVTG